jgi:OFA family oxalate/formate antiporter-like MFS transporter
LISINKKGILAVVGSSLAIFWPGALIFGFPGVMAPHWQDMFHVGRGAIGNTLFFVLVAVGIFMFLVGRWQERYGTRAMITIGALICSFSVIIIAYASNLIMLYAWAFLTGVSSCFILIPALTTVQRWYPQKRGMVSGIVNLVFGLSAAIMSPIFGYMLISMGYVPMSIAIAILALFIGLGAAYLARAPETVPDTVGQSMGKELKSPDGMGVSLTVGESIRTRSFWFLWTTWALQGAAGIAMVTISTSYGLSKGFAMESAIVILTAFNITNGAGRLVSGYLSDLVGRNLTMSTTFFAAGCAYFILPHASSLASCALLAAVVGLAFGTLFAVSAPLASDCFGLKHFGAIFGLVFTAYGFLAGALGPSLSGYLLDMTKDNFSVVFIYLGLFCVISGLCILKVVPPHKM